MKTKEIVSTLHSSGDRPVQKSSSVNNLNAAACRHGARMDYRRFLLRHRKIFPLGMPIEIGIKQFRKKYGNYRNIVFSRVIEQDGGLNNFCGP